LPHINYHSVLEVIAPMFATLSIVNMLELLIIGFFIFKIYKYITGTHAEQLLKGILMLLLSLFLSKLFKLEILGKVLESVVNIVIFSMVVIFQPELRRFLGYLGQRGFFTKNTFVAEIESDVKDIVDEVVHAVKHLSKSHTGALIVFQNTPVQEAMLEVGTKLNARITTELLLTIFHPNTPLHDGAVVIGGDKILASSVLLPLTEDPKLSWQYGTRHRAAIGMSEASDATCLVVSEETGNISIAQDGKLKQMASLDELRTELSCVYGICEPVGGKSVEKVEEKTEFNIKSLFLPKFSFSKYPGFLFKKEKN
jgi:diadenylate cyclase